MRRGKISTVALVAAIACTTFAAADSSKNLAGQSLSMAPPPEMKSIQKALGGRWTITGKYEVTEASPKGGELHGVELWRSGPKGFTFREEADDYGPEGEFLEFNVMWWDSTTRKFGGLHCTSGDPRGCDLQGALNGVALSWDGKQLVVDLTFPKEAKMPFHFFHEVYSEITPTSFLQTADIGEPGGPLKRWITIHAKRIRDDGRGLD